MLLGEIQVVFLLRHCFLQKVSFLLTLEVVWERVPPEQVGPLDSFGYPCQYSQLWYFGNQAVLDCIFTLDHSFREL